MTPSICHLCIVNVQSMADWISSIPFEAWPQQTRLADGQLRPAMVTDLAWPYYRPDRKTFREAARFVVEYVMRSWEFLEAAMPPLDPGRQVVSFEIRNYMLSVVMPGHSIDPHADQQAPGWVTRVHIPLLTNPSATFIFPHDDSRLLTAGRSWNMQVGEAYLVDVSRVHEVRNEGSTPRVHFMFDVLRGQWIRP